MNSKITLSIIFIISFLQAFNVANADPASSDLDNYSKLSLMMTDKEKNHLDQVIEKKSLERNMGQGFSQDQFGISPEGRALFLSAIVYFSQDQWTVFINDEMITESSQAQPGQCPLQKYGVVIKDVSPQHILIEREEDQEIETTDGFPTENTNSPTSANAAPGDGNPTTPPNEGDKINQTENSSVSIMVRPNQTVFLPGMEIKQGDWRKKPEAAVSNYSPDGALLS